MLRDEHKALVANTVEDFNNVADNHRRLMNSAVSNPEKSLYAATFHASIRPFYRELTDKQPSTELVVAEDPADFGGEFYSLVFIGPKGAEFERRYLGEGIFYENLYFYSDTVTTRCHVYSKNGKIKPICVEKLFFNESGHPEFFVEVSEYGVVATTYEHSDLQTRQTYWIDVDGAWRSSSSQIVFLDSAGRVERIEDAESSVAIYDRVEIDCSTEELLDQYLTETVSSFEHGVKTQWEGCADAIGVVLEYSISSPFPPSVGFPTEIERRRSEENSDALGWLCAPDMEHFFECEFFDAYGLAESLNLRIRQLEYPEQLELIDKFYVEMAERVRQLDVLSRCSSAGSDFFCVAHECADGTSIDQLRKYLPQEQLDEIVEKSTVFEQQMRDQIEASPIRQAAHKNLENARDASAAVMERTNALETKKYYTFDSFFAIDPFAYINRSDCRVFDIDVHATPISLADVTDSYDVLYVSNDGVVKVEFIGGGCIRRELYIDRGANFVEGYWFYVDKAGSRELERIERLDMDNGIPVMYRRSCERIYRVDTFETDSAGRVIRIHQQQAYIEHVSSPQDRISSFHYNAAGVLDVVETAIAEYPPMVAYRQSMNRLTEAVETLAQNYANALKDVPEIKDGEDAGLRLVFASRYPVSFPLEASPEDGDWVLRPTEVEFEAAKEINALLGSLGVVPGELDYDLIDRVMKTFLSQCRIRLAPHIGYDLPMRHCFVTIKDSESSDVVH